MKHPGRHKAQYDHQWLVTAINKIKSIKKHNGDKKIITKYEDNPKWRGSKRPIVKGKITRRKNETNNRNNQI